MKDTALYEHLLGLKAPWSVRQVDLFLADQRVVVGRSSDQSAVTIDAVTGATVTVMVIHELVMRAAHTVAEEMEAWLVANGVADVKSLIGALET